MTQEDKEYRQGRSKRQAAANEKITAIAGLGLLLTFIILILTNLFKHGI